MNKRKPAARKTAKRTVSDISNDLGYMRLTVDAAKGMLHHALNYVPEEATEYTMALEALLEKIDAQAVEIDAKLHGGTA
jgi:hypothetical protein